MPYKANHIKLPTKYDRRIKLSDQQREEIKIKYATGIYSQTKLADEYHVSKRLIGFIVKPETYEEAKAQFRERRKDGRYKPTKEEWNTIQKEHRAYKNKLYEEGKIN